MYKIVLFTLISLLFIACGNNNEEGTPSIQKNIFHPLKVKRIIYQKSKTMDLDKNILVQKLYKEGNTTFQFTEINIDGKNKIIGSIPVLFNPYSRRHSSALQNKIFIDASNDSCSSPLKFNSYKLEANNTITLLDTVTLPKEKLTGYDVGNGSMDNIVFKNNLLALHVYGIHYHKQNTNYYNYTVRDQVILYTKDENNSFHYLQTLNSDKNSTRRSTEFGRGLDVSDNLIVVTESCTVYIFAKDTNSSFFHKTDTYTLKDEYSSYKSSRCRLTPEISQNHIFVYHHWARGKDSLFTLHNNTIAYRKDIDDYNLSDIHYFDHMVIKDKVFIQKKNGLTIYSIEDTNNSTTLTKNMDINLSYTPYSFTNGGTTFLLKNESSSMFIDFFQTHPKDKIYLISDTNSSLSLDEGNRYPIYTIDTSSIHPLSYSLDGDDSDYFHIVNHQILPKQPFNFKKSSDMDSNNIYEITLHITDTYNHTKTLPFHIALQHRDYITKDASFSEDTNNSIFNFGENLYLDGQNLVVGSADNIYIFKVNENNLTQITKALNPPMQGTTDSAYVSTLAKVNDVILAGVSNDDTEDTAKGYVGIYKYTNKTLTFQTTLSSPSPKEHGFFGYSITVDKNTTFIGEPGNYTYSYKPTGKVYVYNSEPNATFTLKQTLQAPDEQASNSFGYSIAFNNDYLVVGAPRANSRSGAAYFYKKDANGSMTYLNTLQACGVSYTHAFAKHIAMDDSFIVISDSSNIYIYQIDSKYNNLQEIGVLNSALKDTDTLSIHDKNIFIATDMKVEGYDSLQNVVYHYQIKEDNNVILKEILVDHIIQSTTDDSYYNLVTNGDAIIVGNSCAEINNIRYHGSLTLYKKVKE